MNGTPLSHDTLLRIVRAVSTAPPGKSLRLFEFSAPVCDSHPTRHTLQSIIDSLTAPSATHALQTISMDLYLTGGERSRAIIMPLFFIPTLQSLFLDSGVDVVPIMLPQFLCERMRAGLAPLHTVNFGPRLYGALQAPMGTSSGKCSGFFTTPQRP